MAPRIFTALLVCACATACFEVRPLDRSFDVAVPDGAPPADGGAEAGPVECADIDKTCDGVDDDCDGRYDEDFAEAAACGIGQCRAGSSPARCVSGFPIDCLPGPADDEACDGLDNDCDGAVDEDLTRACGESNTGICRRGTVRCEGGRWTECDAIDPGVEVCDGRDEDCDGQTDEGLTRECEGGGGLCGEGIELCADGEWQGCDGMEPAPEDCNGVDDDCDGAIDENLAPRDCGTDVGACRTGEERCEGGAWSACRGAVSPADVEACNDIDDDCDGRTDEGPGPCGACGLDSRPICPVGVDPCPDAPPMTLCIRELARVDGELGERIASFLVSAGDLNEDGVDDFVTAGRRRVLAISGADGEPEWNRNAGVDEAGALAAADLNGDGLAEILVGDVEAQRGAIQILEHDGERSEILFGGPDTSLGRSVAARDGDPLIAAGAPDARNGEGVVRFLRYGDGDDGLPDARLEESAAFGAAVAFGVDSGGTPVLVASEGPPEDRRVVSLADVSSPPDVPPLEVLPRGPGVGAALVVGELTRGGPPAVAGLNSSQPWLDLGTLPADVDEILAIRLPLREVGTGLALLPGDGERSPLLVVADRERLQLLAVAPGGSAALVEFDLPEELRSPQPEAGPIVAGALRGPDGSRLLAVGVYGGVNVAGRVMIFRVD